MTPEPETSGQDNLNKQSNSSDSSDSESRARRREIAKGKRKAGTPEEGEFEAKKLRLDPDEEGNKTPASQERWPSYNPADFDFDSNRGSDRASHEEDNPLQDEIKIANDHIENYQRYTRDNGEALDAVLKSLKVDKKTIEDSIKNIRDITKNTQDAETAMVILQATNRQFHDIENAVEIGISRREEQEQSD